MKTFFDHNSTQTNIDLSVQMLQDLTPSTNDFSNIVNFDSQTFSENGQDKVIGQYILLINKEISNIFYSQINPDQYQSSTLQSIANYVGFTKENIFQKLVEGSIDFLLGSVAVAILVFVGMSTSAVITAAFLGAFLGFLVKKATRWLCSGNDPKYFDIVIKIKNWAAKVYSDYVIPNDFNIDFEVILSNLENEDDVTNQIRSEYIQETGSSRLMYFNESFEHLGFLDMTQNKIEKIPEILI
jgi:hypothetical protein